MIVVYDCGRYHRCHKEYRSAEMVLNSYRSSSFRLGVITPDALQITLIGERSVVVIFASPDTWADLFDGLRAFGAVQAWL